MRLIAEVIGLFRKKVALDIKDSIAAFLDHYVLGRIISKLDPNSFEFSLVNALYGGDESGYKPEIGSNPTEELKKIKRYKNA